MINTTLFNWHLVGDHSIHGQASFQQGHDTDASYTDSQRTAAYPKLAIAKPGNSLRQDQFGASILHTLVQNRHLIIGTSCPTRHCEKVGKMVTPACSPIIGSALDFQRNGCEFWICKLVHQPAIAQIRHVRFTHFDGCIIRSTQMTRHIKPCNKRVTSKASMKYFCLNKVTSRHQGGHTKQRCQKANSEA